MTDHQDKSVGPYISLPAINFEDPWQEKPAELLQYAANHFRIDSSFSRFVGYLLTDLSVELTLKMFLRLPEDVIKTGCPWPQRQVESNVGFAALLETVWKVAATKQLNGVKSARVQYFHDLRNAMYHDPHTNPPELRIGLEYLELAKLLLERLLKISITMTLIPGTKAYNDFQARESVKEGEKLKDQAKYERAVDQLREVERKLFSHVEVIAESEFSAVFKPSVKSRLITVLTDLHNAEYRVFHTPLARDLPEFVAILERATANDTRAIREYIGRYIVSTLRSAPPHLKPAVLMDLLYTALQYVERDLDPIEMLTLVIAVHKQPEYLGYWYELERAKHFISISNDDNSWQLGYADETTLPEALSILDNLEAQLAEATDAGE